MTVTPVRQWVGLAFCGWKLTQTAMLSIQERMILYLGGVPGRIRTRDPLLRSSPGLSAVLPYLYHRPFFIQLSCPEQ